MRFLTYFDKGSKRGKNTAWEMCAIVFEIKKTLGREQRCPKKSFLRVRSAQNAHKFKKSSVDEVPLPTKAGRRLVGVGVDFGCGVYRGFSRAKFSVNSRDAFLGQSGITAHLLDCQKRPLIEIGSKLQSFEVTFSGRCPKSYLKTFPISMSWPKKPR